MYVSMSIHRTVNTMRTCTYIHRSFAHCNSCHVFVNLVAGFWTKTFRGGDVGIALCPAYGLYSVLVRLLPCDHVDTHVLRITLT